MPKPQRDLVFFSPVGIHVNVDIVKYVTNKCTQALTARSLSIYERIPRWHRCYVIVDCLLHSIEMLVVEVANANAKGPCRVKILENDKTIERQSKDKSKPMLKSGHLCY